MFMGEKQPLAHIQIFPTEFQDMQLQNYLVLT